MTPNLAILSLPAYWLLTILPHGYALSIASQGSLAKIDNRNPRAAALLENLRKRLGPADFARWERCEAAHKNGLENFPLYASAVFAALLADGVAKTGIAGRSVDTSATDKFVYAWFASRALYTLLYVQTTDQKKTFLRTLVYFVGVGLCVQQFLRAANILGN